MADPKIVAPSRHIMVSLHEFVRYARINSYSLNFGLCFCFAAFVRSTLRKEYDQLPEHHICLFNAPDGYETVYYLGQYQMIAAMEAMQILLREIFPEVEATTQYIDGYARQSKLNMITHGEHMTKDDRDDLRIRVLALWESRPDRQICMII